MDTFEQWQHQLALRERELHAQLKEIYNDDDPQNRRPKLDVVFEALKELYREGEKPIYDDLSILDLEKDKWGNPLNDVKGFKKAVPVLLAHLHKPYIQRIREYIARKLATPIAKDAWNDLVDLYLREPACDAEGRKDAKDGLAVALAAVVTRKTLGQLIEITRDTRHGSSRILLLTGIRRFRIDEAKNAISSFADDTDLKIQVARYQKMDDKRQGKREKELQNA